MNIHEDLGTLIGMLAPNAHQPDALQERWHLYRNLVNQRPPYPVSDAFLVLQDELLQIVTRQKGIVRMEDLVSTGSDERMVIWRGDMTTLAVDCIVNAANEKLLGCFIPCHKCIDNAIHTFAGVQLREACHTILSAQQHDEEPGCAKITSAYNLPSSYVLHTVGPIIRGEVTPADERLLASCYASCLALAEAKKLESIAFCCISTGEYCFPQALAAPIAIRTVQSYLQSTPCIKKVIFNVFKEEDERIYRSLLP